MKKNRNIDKEERILSSKLATAIKHERKKHNLSLAELSKLTGVSAAYLCRIEQGKRRNISVPLIQSLSEGLEINLFRYMDIEAETDHDLEDLEAALIDFNFTLNGEVVHPVERQMIISLMQFIILDMDDMHEDFSKQTKLLSMVKEFHEERRKDKSAYERKEGE